VAVIEGVADGVAETEGVGEGVELTLAVGLAVGVGVAAEDGCEKLVASGNNPVVRTVPKIRVLFQINRLAFNT
jgi:hypothetical protein